MIRFSSAAAEYPHVSQQMKEMEEDTTRILKEVNLAKSSMGRVLSAWDSYVDCLSSQQAWLEQSSVRSSLGQRAEVLLTIFSIHFLYPLPPALDLLTKQI